MPIPTDAELRFLSPAGDQLVFHSVEEEVVKVELNLRRPTGSSSKRGTGMVR